MYVIKGNASGTFPCRFAVKFLGFLFPLYSLFLPFAGEGFTCLDHSMLSKKKNCRFAVKHLIMHLSFAPFHWAGNAGWPRKHWYRYCLDKTGTHYQWPPSELIFKPLSPSLILHIAWQIMQPRFVWIIFSKPHPRMCYFRISPWWLNCGLILNTLLILINFPFRMHLQPGITFVSCFNWNEHWQFDQGSQTAETSHRCEASPCCSSTAWYSEAPLYHPCLASKTPYKVIRFCGERGEAQSASQECAHLETYFQRCLQQIAALNYHLLNSWSTCPSELILTRIVRSSVALWLKAYRLKQRGQSCHT